MAVFEYFRVEHCPDRLKSNRSTHHENVSDYNGIDDVRVYVAGGQSGFCGHRLQFGGRGFRQFSAVRTERSPLGGHNENT